MKAAFQPARPADLELLLELMREFYAHERLTFAPAVARRALRALLLDRGLGRAWVIRDAGEIAGYAVLTFGYSLEFHGRDAFLDELYVREPHRGRGIGTRVLAVLARACRAAGVDALHLEVDRTNTRAQAFYRAWGFRDHDRHLMTRWIGSPPAPPKPSASSSRRGSTSLAQVPPGARRIGDEAVQRATGKAWPEWYRVLKRWDVRKNGHGATARHLREEHGLSPWWSQAVTIRYEWEAGLRKD
ncbi:MAG: GNAT family N-acetyltransferase [Gemmatimonadetes bacterium]|nr:GNAT family N-acetyltransferase [Gemmatimonadota bacterium]